MQNSTPPVLAQARRFGNRAALPSLVMAAIVQMGAACTDQVASADAAAERAAADLELKRARSKPPAPTPAPTPSPSPAPAPSGASPALAGCNVFPANAIFNTRIDNTTLFPAHASSASWISTIGATKLFHADWGASEDQTNYSTYDGIPYNVVDASLTTDTAWPSVAYQTVDVTGKVTATGWPSESDCSTTVNGAIARDCSSVPAGSARLPIPVDAKLKIEGGQCWDSSKCGDKHVLVLDSKACRLWEGYSTYRVNGKWNVMSSAAWDLSSNAMRPAGWTSTDAAGLPITPLLAKASEASAGVIAHALRVTFRNSVMANSYAWPASHRAGTTTGVIPMGSLIRLKASFVIPSTWTAQAQAVATAMKQYGLYVADNGSDFFVQGEPSAAWNSATISQLQSIALNQMEFVDLGSVTRNASFSATSYQAAW